MMLTSAFFGWFASIYLNSILKTEAMTSLVIGVFVAILAGAVMGLLLAALSITFKVNQIIGGTVINILAIGVTGFLNRQLFFEKGSVFGVRFPCTRRLTSHSYPPVGRHTSHRKVVCPAAHHDPGHSTGIHCHICALPHPLGLRTRAVGEHPRAADTVGINVSYMRYMNVLIGAAWQAWQAPTSPSNRCLLLSH